MAGEGHRIELFLLVDGQEWFDLRPGILDLLFHGRALRFHLLLDFRHLLIDDRLDLGLLVVGQAKLLRKMI